jgi:hypothetical protein
MIQDGLQFPSAMFPFIENPGAHNPHNAEKMKAACSCFALKAISLSVRWVLSVLLLQRDGLEPGAVAG